MEVINSLSRKMLMQRFLIENNMHKFKMIWQVVNFFIDVADVCGMKFKMLRDVFVHLLLLISMELVRSTLSLTSGCWKLEGRGSIWTIFAKQHLGEIWKFWSTLLKSADQKLCLRLNLHTISLIVIYTNHFYELVLWWTLKVCVTDTDFSRQNINFWHFFWSFWKLIMFC